MKHLFLCITLLSQVVFFFLVVQRLKADWHFSHYNLDAAIGATPYDYRYRMLQGTIYLRDKKPELAGKEFQATLKYFPYYFDAASNLGVSLAQVGQIEQAERIFKAVLASWPTHKESRENLAIIAKVKQ